MTEQTPVPAAEDEGEQVPQAGFQLTIRSVGPMEAILTEPIATIQTEDGDVHLGRTPEGRTLVASLATADGRSVKIDLLPLWDAMVEQALVLSRRQSYSDAMLAELEQMNEAGRAAE